MAPGPASGAVAVPGMPLAGEGWVVGLDVGGTLIKAVVVDPDGRVAERLREPTPVGEGPEAVLDRVVGLLSGIAAGLRGDGKAAHPAPAHPAPANRAPAQPAPVQPAPEYLAAVGIASPGWVDEDAGVVRLAVNVGWRDLEVGQLVSSRLHVPASVGHDVRLGARAEAALGAARGVSDFLFVPIGTGIASALWLGGQPHKGRAGLAGEIGHLVVEPGGPKCRCGGRGCLEVMASASAIARRYRERVPGPALGAAQVRALAEEGDVIASEVWRSAISYLGGALAFAQSLLDLELVVVGGGLAQAGTPFLEQLGAVMAARLAGEGWSRLPRLALAELGDEAGSLGAVLLARSSTPR